MLSLEAKGHKLNQSKVSRLLRKVNAIKSINDQGDMVYTLPHDASPPPIDTTLAELIIDIVANETSIIISTPPGAASLKQVNTRVFRLNRLRQFYNRLSGGEKTA
ncbi:hypothetical protein [Legionella sp. CNM-4043-24]|uniref:hypothetical protein n=1 Tax=Legionella sp. CNM-4043-24 TaxID=3421646 RepID=UPI00403AC3FE